MSFAWFYLAPAKTDPSRQCTLAVQVRLGIRCLRADFGDPTPAVISVHQAADHDQNMR